MLEIGRVDCVEYPVEAEDWVEEHGEVIPVRAFVAAFIAEQVLLGVGLEERPIH